MDFSFVIPAFNEANNIENVITSIFRYVPEVYQYEIIVIDHGSVDETVAIAKAAGARVHVYPKATIAGLRNFGVKNSTGTVLVFLDADILLTDSWRTSIVAVFDAFSNDARCLTGSWCSIPENPNWIEMYWFQPLERGENTHINSGHLIISRQLFDEINGFDESLETGEDYDISFRAKASNIEVVDNASLKVIHEGYPQSLFEFAKREYWHGKGDVSSISAICNSKVAVVALFFLILHAGLIFYSFNRCLTESSILIVSIVCIVIGVSYMKYEGEPIKTIFINSFLYYVYLWARGLAVFSRLSSGNMRKRTR